MIELPNGYRIALYIMSFISVYMAIFWLLLIYYKKEEITKTPEKIKNYPFVSVLIPAYNEEKTIKRTIKSVLASDYPKNKLEIIVLPNGCTDNTYTIVKEIKDKRIRVFNLKNPNKADALNFGIEKAKGELIAVIDADSYIKSDALKLMIPKLKKEKVAAVIPMIEIYKPKKFVQKIQWCEFIVAQFIKKLMAVLGALYITPGVLSIYKKEILKKVGGFDRTSLTEDAEIATRLQYYGYNVEAEIKSIGYTEGVTSWRKLHKQRLRWRRGIIDIIFKYRKMWFNKKYKYLGSFVMPVTILVAILSTSLFVFMFTGIYFLRGYYSTLISEFISTVTSTSSINFSLEGLRHFILRRDSIIYFLLFVMLSLGLIMFLKIRSIIKEKNIYILPLIIFLTYYQLFLTAHWLIAGFYEAFNLKKRW